MVLNPIRTAPKNGEFILLRDEAGGVFELARWCIKNNEWVGEEESPIRIIPAGWLPLAGAPAHHLGERERGPLHSKRTGLHAGLFLLTGLAILLVPSFPAEFMGRLHNVPDQTNARVGDGGTPIGESFSNMRSAGRVFGRSSAHLSASAASNVSDRASQQSQQPGHKSVLDYMRELVSARPDGRESIQVADIGTQSTAVPADALGPTPENERRAAEHQLESVLREIDSLKALIKTLTAGQPDTMQAVQAAQTSALEAKRAADHERRRVDTVVGDLAWARAEIENLKARLAAMVVPRIESSQSAQTLAPRDEDAWYYKFLHSRRQPERAAQ